MQFYLEAIHDSKVLKNKPFYGNIVVRKSNSAIALSNKRTQCYCHDDTPNIVKVWNKEKNTTVKPQHTTMIQYNSTLDVCSSLHTVCVICTLPFPVRLNCLQVTLDLTAAVDKQQLQETPRLEEQTCSANYWNKNILLQWPKQPHLFHFMVFYK